MTTCSTDSREGGASALPTRSGRLASQQPNELRRFIRILQDEHVTSYCEVGARHGDTFYDVMRALPDGSYGVAIDMPNGPWGGASYNALRACCKELRELGYEIDLIIGHSQQVDAALCDAVLIDADHSYDAVKADWERYGGARIVAFHDIDGEGIEWQGIPIGVPKLWAEIRGDYRHEEIIDASDHRRMGIGVIFK